jgi:MoaA/NifB/PqqE/SkfB family radical SAM enzyme
MNATKSPLSAWSKKVRLLRAYAARRPVWCAWQVTYRCNFRCKICSYWSQVHTAAEELTVEEFARGAANLARSGSMLINLAGGEPLLRADLAEVVAALARWHFPFLTTNGWAVTAERARELWQAGMWGASVSIDYADTRHDDQRGRRGALEAARRAVETLRDTRTAPHQRVNVMAVLTAENQADIEDVVRLAAGLGVHFMLQPYGILKTGDASHRPQAPVSERLLDLKRRYRGFLSNPYFLGQFDAFLGGGVGGCRAGAATFNIDQAGLVAKCVEDRENPVGSIVDTAMSTLVARLRERHRVNHCRACWYNCRGEVEALYSPRGLLASLPMLMG